MIFFDVLWIITKFSYNRCPSGLLVFMIGSDTLTAMFTHILKCNPIPVHSPEPRGHEHGLNANGHVLYVTRLLRCNYALRSVGLGKWHVHTNCWRGLCKGATGLEADCLTDRLNKWLTDLLTDWISNWLTDWTTDRFTDRLNNWQTYWHWTTDRLTDRLNKWLTDWLTDWQTEQVADLLTDWTTDWLTYWQTEQAADLLTDWITDWLTDRLNNWLTYWHTE
jgi:hypothetical protein